MKAVRVHEYGGPEVLRYEDVPEPQAGPGQVVVAVKAAGVNPVDWKLREGWLKEMLDLPLPLTPGGDIAGTVVEVGAGVEQFKVGDEVYAMLAIGEGAYAEQVAVDVSKVALKPQSLDYIQTASLPIAVLTAWQALFDHAGLQAGQRVLIHAASGGVGSFAVQFARWKGAHVIATTSARNADFVRELGADEVVDYNAVRFEDVVKDVDVVLDAVGAETQERSFATLKPGGILVSIVSRPSQELAEKYGVRTDVFLTEQRGDQLAEIAGLIDAGEVKTYVEEVFPLAEAGRAHDRSATRRVRGKIVLQVA